MREARSGSKETQRFRNIYREQLVPSRKEEILSRMKVASWFLFLLFSLGALSAARVDSSVRTISSVKSFPVVSATNDQDDILRAYPVYLRFVLEVGNKVDTRTAHKLAETYTALEKRYPEAAARFLKGLRFEMVQKLELMGASPRTISSSSPEMKRWVGKFLKEWLREADEALFRAVTVRKTKANAE